MIRRKFFSAVGAAAAACGLKPSAPAVSAGRLRVAGDFVPAAIAPGFGGLPASVLGSLTRQRGTLLTIPAESNALWVDPAPVVERPPAALTVSAPAYAPAVTVYS
jgi:hypothetical protein